MQPLSSGTSISCVDKNHPHNLKVVGSNPTPATKHAAQSKTWRRFFYAYRAANSLVPAPPIANMNCLCLTSSGYVWPNVATTKNEDDLTPEHTKGSRADTKDRPCRGP